MLEAQGRILLLLLSCNDTFKDSGPSDAVLVQLVVSHGKRRIFEVWTSGLVTGSCHRFGWMREREDVSVIGSVACQKKDRSNLVG
jgi:hypothetical protein